MLTVNRKDYFLHCFIYVFLKVFNQSTINISHY